MIKKAQAKRNTEGFTLIELAVVLVIIGLIIGGILVGVDLVNAAQVRGTVSQFEKYNAAVNTFRVKYDALPGDINQSDAGSFGLFTLATAAGPGEGDGNGLIEGGSSGGLIPSGETLVFWRHLSDAGLLDGIFGSTNNGAIDAATGMVATNNTKPATSIPPTKVTPTQFFVVYADSGQNFMQFLPVATITSAGAYTFGVNGINPIQAYDMDVKLDDGLPNAGIVTAQGLAAVDAVASWNMSSTPNDCLSNGADATDVAATYNRAVKTGGKNPSCSLRYRLQ